MRAVVYQGNQQLAIKDLGDPASARLIPSLKVRRFAAASPLAVPHSPHQQIPVSR